MTDPQAHEHSWKRLPMTGFHFDYWCPCGTLIEFPWTKEAWGMNIHDADRVMNEAFTRKFGGKIDGEISGDMPAA